MRRIDPACAGAPCPLCRSAARVSFATTDRNRRVDDRAFTYRRCRACATLFLSPVPEDLPRYYSADYRRLPDREAFRAAVATEAAKLALLPPAQPGGRLVDVGAGTGAFCVAAGCAGYKVLGLEIDAGLVAFAREQGVDAQLATTDASGLDEVRGADVVTAWHVIEHVADPGLLLCEIERALAPGGVAVIATPNPTALQHRVLRSRWPHIDAPRHLALIPSATLVAYAAGIGLRCRMLVTTDAAGLGWNAFGWDQALRRPGARGVEARLRYWLGELVKAGAGPIERRGRHGSTYTVVLDKPRLPSRADAHAIAGAAAKSRAREPHYGVPQ